MKKKNTQARIVKETGIVESLTADATIRKEKRGEQVKEPSDGHYVLRTFRPNPLSFAHCTGTAAVNKWHLSIELLS